MNNRHTIIGSAAWAMLAALLIVGCTHEQTERTRDALNSPVVRDVVREFPFGETILGVVTVGLGLLAEYQRRRARRTEIIATEIVRSVEPALTREAKDKIVQSEKTQRFVERVKNGTA
jgi:hypothetical protein